MILLIFHKGRLFSAQAFWWNTPVWFCPGNGLRKDNWGVEWVRILVFHRLTGGSLFVMAGACTFRRQQKQPGPKTKKALEDDIYIVFLLFWGISNKVIFFKFWWFAVTLVFCKSLDSLGYLIYNCTRTPSVQFASAIKIPLNLRRLAVTLR